MLSFMNKLIEEVTNQVYEKIAKRVLNRKKELKKTREQITDTNVQLLSNIMHNKRIKTRNPYLLNSGIIYDIKEKLNFKSSYVLIWGKDKELDSILKILFINGLKYLQENKTDNELIKDCLLEYLPLAKTLAEYKQNERIFKPNKEIITKDYNLAFEYLYYGISSDLQHRHEDYFKGKETKKLNNNIAKFVSSVIPEILHKYLKERHSQGKEAFRTISKVLKYQNEYEINAILFGPPIVSERILNTKTENKKILKARKKFVETGNNYIDALVDMQKVADPLYEKIQKNKKKLS